jgi:hypothetical protein
MIVAILGNGPSKEDWFKEKDEHPFGYVMGCNFPWTDVDGTTIIDGKAADGWIKYVVNKEAPEVKEIPLWLSASANARFTNAKLQDYLAVWKKGEMEVRRRESSAHVATKVAIELLGATQVRVYGVDTFFTMENQSSTWKYVHGGLDGARKVQQITDWRTNWHKLKEENPNVQITMVRLEDASSITL